MPLKTVNRPCSLPAQTEGVSRLAANRGKTNSVERSEGQCEQPTAVESGTTSF